MQNVKQMRIIYNIPPQYVVGEKTMVVEATIMGEVKNGLKQVTILSTWFYMPTRKDGGSAGWMLLSDPKEVSRLLQIACLDAYKEKLTIEQN